MLGDETITLHYEEDLDGLATVITDRTGAPIGGQVHVTVSDFRLNLDPTGKDVWTVYADGSTAAYKHEGADAIEPGENWVGIFGGLGGKLTVDADDGVVDVTATPTTPSVGTIRLTETGSNTGVFESQNDDDSSNIVVTGDENDSFKIEYADSDVQVFIEDFDSTLETISDGTWNSGNTITVRLSNENLNTNTLTEQDMAIDDDFLPVLIQGDPITLHTVEDITRAGDETFGEEWSVNKDTQVLTLRATNTTTTFTITLSDSQLERLKSGTMSSYVHYSSEKFEATTDAQLNTTGLDLKAGAPIPVVDGAPLRVLESADGKFNITFTTDAISVAEAAQNEAVGKILEAAENAANEVNARSVLGNIIATEGETDDQQFPEGFIAALNAIDMTADGANVKSTLEAIRDTANENLNEVTGTIVADIFTFGADANDAIYRALLEETDSASGVFEGTIKYEMLNQRTVDRPDAHDNVDAISDELTMILNTGYTGSDAPEFTYDGDNASEDAPTNTGEVSVDASTYRVSDDVTITLTDADLNTDSGAREIYRIVNSSGGTIVPRLASIAIGDLSCVSKIKDVSLRETASDSGIFEGSFEVPDACGVDSSNNRILTTGESITVTYADFRDETGGDSEWTDSATIGADTGSVSLDRTVYPIPTAANADNSIEATQVTITVTVDDSDVDTSSSSTQTIKDGVTLTVAGVIVDLGELKETEPDSGIFDVEVKIGSSVAGKDANDRSKDKAVDIEQGNIITVRYIDESDASGNKNSVSDSATFDLRNAVLTSDKSVYVIGQDALLTLIEADLNLDSGTIDNVDLERINWDSEAYDGSLADARADLGPVPTNLRETGENTGIFQVVITISESIDNNPLERGEEITLTYLDRGPSGADFVGDDERDVELQIETSNFGATVELDQNVYTWTDKVFITIVASDYNFDPNIVDEIGTPDKGEIIVRTRADEVQYRLAETGPDTGVFTGELVLTGDKDALKKGGPQGISSEGLAGPTDGKIKTKTSDGISMSFAYSDSEFPLVASALIRWNVGEVQWLEASYAATGSGVVRIIDPDMNINPDAVDSINAVVYSDTFIGGIDLTLTETQEASGIFEGTVEFDPKSASDGHRLQVTEGDIITASYEDETLPKPDNGDTLEITATTLIGSIVPPLARAPASNTAIVDAFGNSLASVSVDQQVQITADLTSGQDREQNFAYLVQIQNEDEVTVQLTWLAGTLGGGATFSAAQSWTPSETGSYTATIFVWESVNNPTALSPQLSITIDVV